MIPRVARLGTGFAGAGNYYLHDKRGDPAEPSRPSAEDYHLHDKAGLQTSERVGFTATRNLPTQDAAKGLKCMAWLAANAQSVRQAAVAAEARAAGVSYDAYVRAKNPFRGRKAEKPVYSLSLAWHPTRNRKPTDAQMLAAADEVLGVLGLKDHQAVIIQHTDTKHPHVHLVVNRVHPHTGKYARLGNDYLKVSKWALQFEKRTGLIVCPVRVDNWQKRDAARITKTEARKTDPKAKGEWVLAKDVPRGDHDWFKSVAHRPPDQIRQARKARQERDREQFRMIAARREAYIDGILTRKYGLTKRDAETERERLLRAEGWRKHRDRHPVALLLQPRHLADAIIDVFTARAYFRKRRIKALDRSVTALDRTIRDHRRREQLHQTDSRKRMLQRHAAECRRDEDRIAALLRGRRGKETSERGRKVFNWRGGIETARHVPPNAPVITLADIHAKVVDKAKAAEFKARNALGNIVRALGGTATAEQLRKFSLGGWLGPRKPTAAGIDQGAMPKRERENRREDRRRDRGDAPPIEPDRPLADEQVNRTTPVEDAKAQAARRELASKPVPINPAERAAFEVRRDAAIARIEADQAQQRQRRKRVRPRGKVRRLE